MALNFKHLDLQLMELEEYFPFHHCTNRLVSKASVGWHISHSFKVINQVSDTLRNSQPEKYKKEFCLSRTVVFLTGRFPRGKAKAPEAVIPEEEIALENLIQDLDKVKQNLSSFEALEENNYFRHPYFKQLNKVHSKRLIEVHTMHHLKIVRDILKSRNT